MAIGNSNVELPESHDEVGVLEPSFSSMRAESALEARSRFIATMSHEIRTPLNGILPVAELLRTSELDPAQRQKVDTIVQSGKALSSIVDDILDVSMLETGKLTLRHDTFSPMAICEQACAIILPSAVTASVQQEHVEKCRAAGMDDFMAKPLKLDRMKTLLAG